MTLTVGSLFAGIGGIDLGLERAGMKTVWQVEIDPWCQKVLAKHWPDVERFADVKEVGAHNLQPVDVIAGGFPCQDLSYAGKGAGIKAGTRSGLWFEYARIIRELRPRYVFVENVPALLSRGLDIVLSDLAEIGYDAEWDCIPAAAVGAPHLRNRIWIVAYPRGEQHEGDRAALGWAGTTGFHEAAVADAHGERQAKRGKRAPLAEPGSGGRPFGGGGGGVAWQESIRGAGETPRIPHADRGRLEVGSQLDGEAPGYPPNGHPCREHSHGLCDDVSHATCLGREPRRARDAAQEPGGRKPHRGGIGPDLADADHTGLEGRHLDRSGADQWLARARRGALEGIWRAEPGMGRVAHGIPQRVDRLRGLGNAVVPQVVEAIGRRIVAWEEGKAMNEPKCVDCGHGFGAHGENRCRACLAEINDGGRCLNELCLRVELVIPATADHPAVGRVGKRLVGIPYQHEGKQE